MIGSSPLLTSACMRSSRIIKLVAEVSSSISRVVTPASIDSCNQADCEVEPEASCVLKSVVSLPIGK
ncbi:Uncharacterised protein [Vibrio cholerae]|nr:Uncharacterised protein [Vibrio cholerae]CSC92653.1 Uncharacterised protein [Vibrio cholerae]